MKPKRYGDEPAFGFVLADEIMMPSTDRVPVPGPTLVLKRGEPVEISLVNRLPESTAIHWHGMELESYYDGVHGFSGAGQRVTPLIEPGGSFVVRFTPPRAGTFMYHTHLHDDRQLTSGLYGAMIVLDEGETFDEATDHVIVMGRSRPGTRPTAVLNGQNALRMVWKAGVRHRIRLINITPSDIFAVVLQTTAGPVGLAAADERRRAAAAVALQAGSGKGDHRRRRDLRLRVRRARGTKERVARGAHARRQVGEPGARDREVT